MLEQRTILKFGDIADFSNGLNFSLSDYSGDILLIGVSHFGDRLFPDYSILDSIASNVVTEKDLLKSGDLLFVRSNGNKNLVGRCMLIKEPPRKVTYSGFCIRARIRDNELYNPAYFAYHFRTPLFRKTISGASRGANIQNLNQRLLSDYILSVPSREEQDRIVSILSAYDDLIATNQKQITLLEETAQRIYKEWFVDFRFPGNESIPIEKGLPYGWERSSLGEIAVDAGINVKVQDRDNYCYYLPIDCMPKKSLGYVEVNDISLAESSLQSFAPGDIVMGAMRPYFHKVVIARDYGLTRNTCFVINAKDSVYHDFLTMLIYDESTIRYATQNSVGTTMPYIRWKDFIQMPVVVPERGIAEKFSSIMSPLFDSIHVRSKDIQKAREARDILLGKLLS